MRSIFVPVAGLLAVLVACEGVPTSPSPSSTTAVEDRPVVTRVSSRPAVIMRNPDRDFSNQFWQALIFDQYDDPGTLRGQEARRLRQHLNVYIQMIDERGEVVFSSSERDYMVRTIPVAARSITGATYDGRIEVGHSVRGEQRDWIKIEVVDHHESASSTTCALAWVGAEAGHIWLIRDQYRQCDFPALFIHEFGHAYGLWHVGDPSSVMFPRDNGIRQFSGSDRYHAQLAYRELQRGETYCGWPYGAECVSRDIPVVGRSELHRVLVVD